MRDNSWTVPNGTDERVQSFKCPYCNKEVAGKKHNVIQSEFNAPVNHIDDIYYILECPNCHRPTIYYVPTGNTYPNGRALRSVSSLPNNIENIYNEVRSCISAECYTSAVILARTAIMHISVEQGADKNKSLVYYVEYLSDNDFIPPNGKLWVDEIRKMANKSVHDLELWKKEDAYKIGKFLMYLLIFIYELPAQV